MESKVINIRFNEAYTYSGGGNDILFEYSLDNITFHSGYYSFPAAEPLSGDYPFNIGSQYIPEVWIRVSVKNNLDEVVLSETFHYNPGTSCGITSLTQIGLAVTLQGFIVMAYKTGDPNQLILQEAVSEGGAFSDFFTIDNAINQSPETGSNPKYFNTPLNDGRYYRLKVLDVDGNPVYSNAILFSSTQETTVTLNSISEGIPNQLNASFVNAYENNVGFKTVYIYQSDDGISGWFIAATSYLQSSPFTGNDNFAYGAVNGKYYRIGVKDSQGHDVYSNVLQYVSNPKTITILQAISSCNGSEQDESVQVEVNYDATGHHFYLQYWNSVAWTDFGTTICNGQSTFYITALNTSFQPVFYQVRVHDVNSDVYSSPVSLQMASCP